MRKIHIVDVLDVSELIGKSGKPFYCCRGFSGGKRLSFLCFEPVKVGDLVGVTYKKKGEKFYSEVYQIAVSDIPTDTSDDYSLPF